MNQPMKLDKWESHLVGISKHWFAGEYYCDKYETIYPMICQIVRDRNGIPLQYQVENQAIFYVIKETVNKLLGKLISQHQLDKAMETIMFPNIVYPEKDHWKRFITVSMGLFCGVACKAPSGQELIQFDMKELILPLKENGTIASFFAHK